MNKEQGGPAFPQHPQMAASLGYIPGETDAGMSLRDYFAAKVMLGFLAGMESEDFDRFSPLQTSMAAYKVADAMIQARKA